MRLQADGWILHEVDTDNDEPVIAQSTFESSVAGNDVPAVSANRDETRSTAGSRTSDRSAFRSVCPIFTCHVDCVTVDMQSRAEAQQNYLQGVVTSAYGFATVVVVESLIPGVDRFHKHCGTRSRPTNHRTFSWTNGRPYKRTPISRNWRPRSSGKARCVGSAQGKADSE